MNSIHLLAMISGSVSLILGAVYLIFALRGYGRKYFWSQFQVWPDPLGLRNLTKPAKSTQIEKINLFAISLMTIIVGLFLLVKF